ncbi:MAG TPA: prolipoprotein diacylglyceryl transferase, partial [Chthoniobacteraceae bacterium]|nr:prolipoprotein diacylglyceryl transferase [Chthoniobacteraceae bacterium]
FGRVAKFVNGELYGRATQVPWAMQFPKELLEDANLREQAVSRLDMSVEAIFDRMGNDPKVRDVLHQILTPRHPSQLYEALLEGVFLFTVLWLLRTKTRCPRGVLTGMFFIVYALVRIVGENFRLPDAPLTGFLTRGQFLSLFLILIGGAFVTYGLKTRHYEKADLPEKAHAPG